MVRSLAHVHCYIVLCPCFGSLLCESNHVPQPGGDGCQKCSSSNVYVYVCLIVTAIVVAFALFKLWQRQDRIRRRQIKSTAKILIVFLQILTALPHLLNVHYPNPVSFLMSFLSIIASLSDLNIGDVGLGCFVEMNFYDELLMATLLPLAVIFIVFVILLYFQVKEKLEVHEQREREFNHVRTKATSSVGEGGEDATAAQAARPTRRRSSMARMRLSVENLEGASAVQHAAQQCTTAILLVAFCVLPGTATLIMYTFSCEPFDNGDVLLRADLSISCETNEHQRMVIFASFMVLVYVRCRSSLHHAAAETYFLCVYFQPIGIPTLFSVLLWRVRETIRDADLREARAQDCRHVSFLYDVSHAP